MKVVSIFICLPMLIVFLFYSAPFDRVNLLCSSAVGFRSILVYLTTWTWVLPTSFSFLNSHKCTRIFAHHFSKVVPSNQWIYIRTAPRSKPRCFSNVLMSKCPLFNWWLLWRGFSFRNLTLNCWQKWGSLAKICLYFQNFSK